MARGNSVDELRGLFRDGPAIASRFRVIIPNLPNSVFGDSRDLNILCSTASVPGRGITTMDSKTSLQTRKVASAFVVSDFSVTFNMTNNLEAWRLIRDWYDNIIFNNESSRGIYLFGFKDDYSTQIIVEHLDHKGDPTIKTKIKGAFPISLTNMEFTNAASNEVMSCTVGFSYDNWEVEFPGRRQSLTRPQTPANPIEEDESIGDVEQDIVITEEQEEEDIEFNDGGFVFIGDSGEEEEGDIEFNDESFVFVGDSGEEDEEIIDDQNGEEGEEAGDPPTVQDTELNVVRRQVDGSSVLEVEIKQVLSDGTTVIVTDPEERLAIVEQRLDIANRSVENIKERIEFFQSVRDQGGTDTWSTQRARREQIRLERALPAFERRVTGTEAVRRILIGSQQ